MKVLFFHAAAGHPNVAAALMGQASTTLRPFQQFLRQAIHTAKERQFRYQLPWEPVRNVVTVRIERLDTVLAVPRRPPGMLLADWPTDAEVDSSKAAFIVNRSVPVEVESAKATPSGLRVSTTPPLLAGDQLVWCGIQCTVTQEEAPEAPRTLTDRDGRALALIGPPQTDGEHRWHIRVEGGFEGDRIYVDGEEVEVEIVSADEGPTRVFDAAGRVLSVSGMLVRAEDAPPAEGPLRGDDGMRYRWWLEGGRDRRPGRWVQLLPPEDAGSDDLIDPRAAFCESDIREVWTQPRHDKSKTRKVRRVDAERYQLLLDELPPVDGKLYLPVDLRNLYLQQRALQQLAEAPLPHHQGLLRLCEDPECVRWPAVSSVAIADDEWRSLTDPTRSGTSEQRRFVEKALGSPDFAFLEGPPGSGKTTAICELVQQLIESGQRVLLCASTHVAIDNVLERLIGTASPIDAVRIGRLERVDDNVQQTQLDARVGDLVEAWRKLPGMRTHGDQALTEMAERTVIMAANLTCGTTMGIVNHPLFRGRDQDMDIWARPITTMPHWDVLIVDEASKTLIQELMVPALMAKRWIVVGDVRQLPPFADRADIVANLRDLVDEKDRPVFPRDHQRACLLLFRMTRRQVRQPGMCWLLVEPPGVLCWIERELAAEPEPDLLVVRVVPRGDRTNDGPVALVTIDQLRHGGPEALLIAAADWVLVDEGVLVDVSELLPSHLLLAKDLLSHHQGIAENDALLLRQGWWLARAGSLRVRYRDERSRRDYVMTMEQSQGCETDWLSRHDLAQELAWRLTRIHELRHSRNDRERGRLRGDIERLRPHAVDIREPLAEIEDIGLPSILEVLQEGIGEERSKRRSALTMGFRTSRADDFEARFESLSYQHRMHPEISSFSREVIYDGQALKDANTVAQRDARLGWDFGHFRARRVWLQIQGHESGGENGAEVKAIETTIREFIEWVKRKGRPERTSPRHWEVACLSFYVKQEQAISRMLAQLTGDRRSTRFAVGDAPVEIVCGTVDRFQGREADLVLLSMRNTRRVGFLDSPNRLNVAVTRARQQLVVVGNADYFGRCRISELELLVRKSPLVHPPHRLPSRRSR